MLNGDIKIGKRTFLGMAALLSLFSFANYVSLVDSESAGGVLVVKESSPVGSIMMWGTSTPPSGWIELNGQSTSGYSELASLYGSTVPDFRGQFVRGWDNSRGVDLNRGLLTEQGDAIRNLTGSIGSAVHGPSGGAFSSGNGVFYVSGYDSDGASGYGGYGTNYRSVNIDVSRQVPTASENRPKNITVMYIVKAE